MKVKDNNIKQNNACITSWDRYFKAILLFLCLKVPEWWLLNVAALRTGTVLLPGTTLLTAADIAARIAKSESDCVIGDAEVATKV